MAYTKAELEALRNALLASGQPITASIHRDFAQRLIDEMYDPQSRANLLASIQADAGVAPGDKVFIVRGGEAYLVPAAALGGAGATLSSLGDVLIVDPENTQLISYNDVNGFWENVDTSLFVLSLSLNGFAAGANTPILATDTLLEAFEKAQGQIDAFGLFVTLDTSQTVTGAKVFDNPSLIQSGANPILRIKTTDSTAALGFRNAANEDQAGFILDSPGSKFSILTTTANTDIEIGPHGTGAVILPNVASGAGTALGVDASNKLVKIAGGGGQKVFVVTNPAIIGLTPNVSSAGTSTYNFLITSSGFSAISNLPLGTLVEFEFGAEVNCTVANLAGDMALIISLRFGDYLLSTPVSSLSLSTSTVKTLHTTKAAFIIGSGGIFSSQVGQKAFRSSGPSYDRDATRVGAQSVGGGSSISIAFVFGQSNANNYLKINHGFLKISLP